MAIGLRGAMALSPLLFCLGILSSVQAHSCGIIILQQSKIQPMVTGPPSYSVSHVFLRVALKSTVLLEQLVECKFIAIIQSLTQKTTFLLLLQITGVANSVSVTITVQQLLLSMHAVYKSIQLRLKIIVQFNISSYTGLPNVHLTVVCGEIIGSCV